MASRFDRRKFLMYGSAALGTSWMLKACGGTQEATTEGTDTQETGAEAPEGETAGAAKDYQVAIALPGIKSDKAWNQAGFEGVEVAKENLGVETAFVEQVGQADQVEALSDFARRGYKLVFAHGGQFDAAIEQVAAEFPDTFFVGVNGAVAGANMASLRIDSLQASYVCGVIAANMTKSNKLAYIAGQEFQATQDELQGFKLGAQSVNPAIEVASTFTGDWNDAAKAKEAVVALISAGADVVYQWLDNAAPAVLQACQEAKVYAFGNTADQLELAPEAVVTSAVKRIDLAIALLAQYGTEGTLEGKIYTLGLEESDILYLGEYGEFVPEELKALGAETAADIVAGDIQFEPCADNAEMRCLAG